MKEVWVRLSTKSMCFKCDEFTESIDYKCTKCMTFKLIDTIYVLDNKDTKKEDKEE